MKIIVAFLVAASLSGCAASLFGTSVDATHEIFAATEAWRAAYDSRDAARIAAQYSNDAVFWGTTMKSVATTPAGIASYFKDAATRPNARVVFTEQHVRIYGDTAFSSGACTFTDNRDGKDIANPSRYSMVFRRQAGVWVLVHHHSSRVP